MLPNDKYSTVTDKNNKMKCIQKDILGSRGSKTLKKQMTIIKDSARSTKMNIFNKSKAVDLKVIQKSQDLNQTGLNYTTMSSKGGFFHKKSNGRYTSMIDQNKLQSMQQEAALASQRTERHGNTQLDRSIDEMSHSPLQTSRFVLKNQGLQ